MNTLHKTATVNAVRVRSPSLLDLRKDVTTLLQTHRFCHFCWLLRSRSDARQRQPLNLQLATLQVGSRSQL